MTENQTPVSWLLEPIGVNHTLEAVERFPFCSTQCRAMYHNNRGVEEYIKFGSDTDGIEGEVCTLCGKVIHPPQRVEKLRCEVCGLPTVGDTLCNVHYEEQEKGARIARQREARNNMRVKAIRCFQNNGPDYWNIYDGVKVFGVNPIATCETEEQAKEIVRAINQLREEEGR
jgi:hypothetical protein